MIKPFILPTIMLLLAVTQPEMIHAQNNSRNSEISRIIIPTTNNRFYTVYYRDSKPDDVPRERSNGKLV